MITNAQQIGNPEIMDLIETLAKNMWECEKRTIPLTANEPDAIMTWNGLGIEVKEYWTIQAIQATSTIMHWLEPHNTVVTVPSKDFILSLNNEIVKSEMKGKFY